MEWDIAENGQRGLIIDGIWYCEELVVPAISNLAEDKQRLRRALCEYQLRFWTLQYHTERWFAPLLGDDSEGCSG